MPCITADALLSGLLLRIERDGYHPSPADVGSILAAGCSRAHVEAGIERLPLGLRDDLRRALEGVSSRDLP